MTTEADRFCSQCGRSRVPLNVPHVSARCADCGETSYYVRTGPGGRGIKIEDGERITIPLRGLEVSLDPASRLTLFRGGIPFLLRAHFLAGYPKGPEDLREFIDRTEGEADAILKGSPDLQGLDLSLEADSDTAIKRLENRKTSREWHGMVMGSMAHAATDAISAGDALKAAWAGYMLGTARGLTIVTEPTFEQTLWRGYLASMAVYGAAAAAAQTPAQAEAIKKLEPLFRGVGEVTLYTWVESKQPIGPLIGVKDLPEETLGALAKWHLASFQRERDEAKHRAAEARAHLELRLKWLGFGVTLTGLLGTAIVGLLKYLGRL